VSGVFSVILRSRLAALAAALLVTVNPIYVDRRLERARALIGQKSWREAREVLHGALEGDPAHPIVLALLAQTDLELNDQDEALYDLNRLAETVSHAKDLTKADRALIDPLLAKLKQIDPLGGKRDAARDLFRQNLLKLAQDHLNKKRYHSARAVYQELLTIDPDDQAARAGLKQVQKEGGNELAAQGLAGGEDLLGNVTPQWIEDNDRQHMDWDNAWEKKTRNYTVYTNAGYEMLQNVAAAMEQLNHFYRIFHQYKTDGSETPHIAVKIYRTHDEYEKKGHPPFDWAGGHYDGSSVQTWDYREGKKGSLEGTLPTIAH
jgi:tetratricopeptide (TPR) repeat protein